LNPVFSVPPNTEKRKLYADVYQQLEALLGDEEDLVVNAANTSALLFQLLPDINWAGFYFVRGNELVLGPFQGKPACSRIALGKGVCGTAAANAETIIVQDVSSFPGHIACDPASRSEIVVPLINWGSVLGVLDIDSAQLGRFDEEDREGLESIASLFVASQASDELPNFTKEVESIIWAD
jgi:GAF domain-containing protein